MRYFFCRSFPVRLVRAIRVLEPPEADNVVFADDKFPPETPDTAWISTLAAENDWNVISMDYAILKKPIERAAWDESELTGFFFDGSWGNLKIAETTWRFFRWWPDIKLQAGLVAAGATFSVPIDVQRRLQQLRQLQT